MFQPAAPRLRACSARLGHNAGLRYQPWARCLGISPAAVRTLRQARFSSVSRDDEDGVIREVFDQSTARRHWFSPPWPARGPNGANAGLFKNRYLTKPEGFQMFARRNIQKASVLVGKVLDASSLDEYRAVVKHLDRLSDLLCRVLDLCDFVRMTHGRRPDLGRDPVERLPGQLFVRAEKAQRAHQGRHALPLLRCLGKAAQQADFLADRP